MTSLIRPDALRYDEWAQMLREFDDEVPHGSGQWEVTSGISRAGFAEHLTISARLADTTAEPPGAKVHCDQFWVTDGDALVGFLQLRHRLNDLLYERGGHIGYSIRPSRRREGHASAALHLSLDRARELGLDRVLVTCDDDNLASAATIESQGGKIEDVRHGKRRYWIDLTQG